MHLLLYTEDMPPEFETCPGNIRVDNDPTLGSAVVTFMVVAVDDLDASPDVTSTHASGDAFNLTSTTVVFTVTDSSGQTAECSFVVTVEGQRDI